MTQRQLHPVEDHEQLPDHVVRVLTWRNTDIPLPGILVTSPVRGHLSHPDTLGWETESKTLQLCLRFINQTRNKITNNTRKK